MENLFKLGSFKLNSGRHSSFKIDCDALTDEDWECLAWLISERVPAFKTVEGIPRGGLKLAEKLQKYTVDTTDTILIVDDVLTTGRNMERVRNHRNAVGAVIFARDRYPAWITPLFTMKR